MRVHDVISVAYLERVTDPAVHPYLDYDRSPPLAVIIEFEREYKLEKRIRK